MNTTKNICLLLTCIILSGYSIGQVNMPDTLMTQHNTTLPNASWKFSFVHLTDVHIGENATGDDYGSAGYNDTMPVGDIGDPAMRLRNTVNWINQNATNLKIQFVIVTGDLTDSGEKSEFDKLKEIMDALTIPYIPLIGNHDVWPYASSIESPLPNGDSIFNTLFAGHFDTLKSIFSNWNDGTRLTQVWNPDESYNSYLQNFSFEYRNYVFILNDFNTRKHASLGNPGIGPEADLMNFTDGTWPWLKQQITNYPNKADKNIFLFSHHPAIKDFFAPIYAFSTGEYDTITQFFNIYKDHLGTWFAGHIHRDKEYGISTWNQSSTVIHGVETAANKEYANGHFRIVKVWDVDSVYSGTHSVSPISAKVYIYPNPNEGKFILGFKVSETSDIQIKIFNILGQEVYTRGKGQSVGTHPLLLGEDQGEILIDLSTYPAGIYNLQLLSDKGIINKKIIIKL